MAFIGAEELVKKHGFVVKPGAAVKLQQEKREGYTDFIELDPENIAWNVIRSEFDELLLRHASASGVAVFEGRKVTDIRFSDDKPVAAVYETKGGKSREIQFDYLVDASGRTGIMSTKYLRNRRFNNSLKNMAFWGYWRGGGLYSPGTERENAPWFEAFTDESGWAWFIPLHNGTKSVGIVISKEACTSKKAFLASNGSGDTSNTTLYINQLAHAPGLLRLLGTARLVTDIKSAADYSYSASQYAGPNYRIAGDAGGVHLAFTGALSAASSIAASIRGHCTEEEAFRFHNTKVGVSYTRFLVVVLGIYKQIRAQSDDVLSDVDEDNFDKAFRLLRPGKYQICQAAAPLLLLTLNLVIQGAADVDPTLTKQELEETLDFCKNVMAPTSPEMHRKVAERMPDLTTPHGPILRSSTVTAIVGDDEEAKHVVLEVNARKVVHVMYGQGHFGSEESVELRERKLGPDMHFVQHLLKGLDEYADRALFKDYDTTSPLPSWRSITYAAFSRDLNALAFYLQQHLCESGVQQKDVVGLWISGDQYQDVVSLYALARAGFVPQVFSRVMATQGGSMINDLLKLRDGKALVYHGYYEEHIAKIDVKTLKIPDLASLDQKPGQIANLPLVEENEVAIIFHTSGTTSGRPKPVPQTHRWLRYQWEVSWPRAWQGDGPKQKIFTNIGSFANVASATLLNKVVPVGNCIIKTSKTDFDASELLAMVNNEGLNNMLLYAARMSRLLKIARTNPEVLKALRSMQQIAYTGEALNPDDIRWVIEQRLPVVAIYASTELSVSLVSDLKEPENLPSMRLIEGSNIQLVRLAPDDPKYHTKLCDIFVPEDAPNCPHKSYRNRPDGHVSGDLFEETRPGYFAFRGRSDDWMKAGKDVMGFCDTKQVPSTSCIVLSSLYYFRSIEDAVLLTCADLVPSCVVVGYCKPIVVFVEPTPAHVATDPVELKAEIIKRTAKFQAGLYPHERFDDRIIVVAAGGLPRTTDKGNIR
ncbi:hypothetical protein H0H93_015433 [Arthromyces matolae]|nr:hypothetical protein H0H93_015433 [Arthromyces matolae]